MLLILKLCKLGSAIGPLWDLSAKSALMIEMQGSGRMLWSPRTMAVGFTANLAREHQRSLFDYPNVSTTHLSSRFSRSDLISRNCRHEDVHQCALSHNDSIRFIKVYFDLMKDMLSRLFRMLKSGVYAHRYMNKHHGFFSLH